MSTPSLAVPFPSHERFEFVKKLGEGSMGVVYAARDKQRESVVALKVTRSLSAKRIYRFKREFRALAELSHPNVIELYELISTEGQWLLVMELIEGEHLLEYLRAVECEREDLSELGLSATLHASESGSAAPSSDSNPGGTLFDESTPREARSGGLNTARRHPDRLPRIAELVDVERLRATLVQLAGALCALHAGGVIHRDLKPSNVMVGADGRVVLMDFGVVAELELERERPVNTGAVTGTPAFMAPEQGHGRPPSAAADWYAFGIILYRALTGLMPFYGSPLALLLSKDECRPTPVTALVRDAPDDLAQLCMRLLAARPGDRPSGSEVLALLGGEGQTRATLAPESGQHLFVGRERELARLRTHYDQIAAGGASFVVLEGPAGIGKSSLARELIAELGARAEAAPLVLRARCRARESLPYKAFDEAIDGLCLELAARDPELEGELKLPASLPYLARLFPVLERFAGAGNFSPLAPKELRTRAIAALRELLETLGRQRPVVLSIEDLQWVDADSIPLLEVLFQVPQRAHLLVVASARESGASPQSEALEQLLGALADAGLCERIALGPLSSEEQRSLLEALEPGISAQAGRVEALTRDAGGHPLLLSELARAQLRQGAQPGALIELETLLQHRIAGLSASSRDLLELLAVGGEALPQRVLGRAAGLEEDALERVVRTLVLERLVQLGASGGLTRADVYQDKISEAILAYLGREELGERADRLALALEEWGEASPASLARLWLEAHAFDKSARYALEAGRVAARALAFAQAQQHYRAAFELGARVELGTHGWDIRCQAWAGLAELARRTGHSSAVVREGEQLALDAQTRAAPRNLARVHYLMGCLLFPRGELEGCARHHQAAFELARACGSHELQARALGGLGDMEFMRGRMRTCAEHCRAAIRIARAHEMPEVEASTLALASSAYFYDGDLRATRRCIERALPIVEALGDRRSKCILYCIGSFRYLQLERRDRAERFVEGMAELVDTLGMAHLRGLVALNRAELALIRGRQSEAAAIASGGLEAAVAAGQRFANASLMGMLALASAQAQERRRWIARGRMELERTPFAHEHMQFYRLALDAALELGEWALVEELASALEQAIAEEPAGWSVFALERARVLAAHGRAPEAAEVEIERQALRERARAAGFQRMLRGL